MKTFYLYLLLLTSALVSIQSVFAQQLMSVRMDKIVICPVVTDDEPPPEFTEPECRQTSAYELNPQNKAIWVKTFLMLSEQIAADNQPYSVYLSGKASSRVFFNGTEIGMNGRPSVRPQDELIGRIDAMFYVSPELIRPGENSLVLQLSSHHGFLTLNSPLNFIGFGSYAAPNNYIQRNLGISLIPLGALLIGALYFLVVSFNPVNRKRYLLFLLMSSLAVLQLLLELSRSVYSYPYPLQDFRLLAIASLSWGFGCCMMLYVVRSLPKIKPYRWLIGGSLLSALAAYSMPGFDNKTAVAILVPSIISAVMCGYAAFKQKSKEYMVYGLIFMLLAVTIFITLTSFHDILFYYLITAVLMALFIQQAMKLNKEQREREKEQALIAKLQFKLEQNQQKNQPVKIQINSAGKIDVISTDQIVYGQAAGDYVELFLNNDTSILFSGSLKELESRVPDTFLRVHRSFLVNMEFIQSLNSSRENQTSSGGFLKLTGEYEVPVSRRIMPTVRQFIADR